MFFFSVFVFTSSLSVATSLNFKLYEPGVDLVTTVPQCLQKYLAHSSSLFNICGINETGRPLFYSLPQGLDTILKDVLSSCSQSWKEANWNPARDKKQITKDIETKPTMLWVELVIFNLETFEWLGNRKRTQYIQLVEEIIFWWFWGVPQCGYPAQEISMCQGNFREFWRWKNSETS